MRKVPDIDFDGMRYGLTTNAWMSSASAMAARTTASRLKSKKDLDLGEVGGEEG